MKTIRFSVVLLLLTTLFACSPDNNETEKFSLTTSVNITEAGAVLPKNGFFEAGSMLELKAVAKPGYEFVEWTGDLSGNENPAEVTFSKDISVEAVFKSEAESIVIYAINDPHGQINNFAKIKAIIDQEKQNELQVFFVSAGDLFSGNPIVDYYPEKGSPIIDLMGQAGMDVSVIGNHEFDYGQAILKDRMQQADFAFICNNITKGTDVFSLPEGQVTIEKDGFSISFIGVVETGSPGNFPLTHPKKVKGLEFSEGVESLDEFENAESTQQADLVVALTHYGKYGDQQILRNHSFVDLVIGGHNHAVYDETVNGKHMIQSGSDLRYMARLALKVKDGEIVDYSSQLINLEEVNTEDATLKTKIEEYNNKPEFFIEIGNSLQEHSISATGCFYTEALQTITGADIVFQNYGGIRDNLDYGTITPYDIYSIDPFGNGLDTFTMAVGELKDFLENSGVGGLSYSGLRVSYVNGTYKIYDESGSLMADEETITVASNDYITNVYPSYFPEPTYTYEATTADYIIEYLEDNQSDIDYEDCDQSI